MANLTGMSAFVSVLKATRTNLVNELRHLDAALSVLGKLGGGSNATRSRHPMSAAGHRKISLAQKKRWAKARAGNVVSIASKRGKGISAAGRKRIAAAQRARWAKIRAAKKTA